MGAQQDLPSLMRDAVRVHQQNASLLCHIRQLQKELEAMRAAQHSHVSELFGTDKSFFMILRPDNYIGLISDDLSPEVVESYLTLVRR